MQTKRLLSIALTFFATTFASLAEPAQNSRAGLHARRIAIHAELDANHEAVQDLYAFLDVTPTSNVPARQFLEDEIAQLDQRNEVLFDELDALDHLAYEEKRRSEVQLLVNRLEAEAVQLRKTKLPLPAATREAKARTLRKSLEDGSWDKISKKPPEEGAADSVSLTVVRLVGEVKALKAETSQLKAEVQQLRQFVEKLSKSAPSSK